MAENSVEIIRFSILREYFSSIEKDTPVPFSEFRVFAFFRERPTTLMFRIISERMTREIERMEKLFPSINLVKNELPAMKEREYIGTKTRPEMTVINAVEKRGETRISINGMEISAVDEQEVISFFRKFKTRISFGQFYRYAAFFGNDGRVKAEYDEDDIQRLEAEEHFRDMAEKDFD